MNKYITSIHNFESVYDENSKILILGSHPSVKSKQEGFYYMNKTNRFWKILTHIYNYDFLNATKEEKISKLKELNIALYDVIYQCDIKLSSDSSIKNVVPTNIKTIISSSKIEKIILNGNKASTLFYKYFNDYVSASNLKIITLKSTSAANATYSLNDLITIWQENLSSNR